MKDDDPKLPQAETWDGEHLSEVALSCLADAQDVVDPVARVHAESCAECMLRIGAMALESHDVGVALKVARQVQVRDAKAAHRFPTLMVAVAATLAVVCGAPALADGVPRFIAWAFAAPRIVPILTTSAVAILKSLSSGSSGYAVSVVATFSLALVGYAVARSSRTTGASS